MRKKGVQIILGILVGLNILAWTAVWQAKNSGLLEVTFFDVGQGDSIFIEIPRNTQILIDGGPDDKVLEKLGEEMPFWDRTIDLVILSHPEKDHLAGLLEVLKSYRVKSILWTGVVRDTAEYQEWQRLVQEEGAEVFIASQGQVINIGETFLQVLHPFERLEGREVKDSNDTSVVASLVFGQGSFLFTGDITSSVEKQLVSDLASHQVLKVGHHGSKTSTSREFVEAVLPEMAVVSLSKDNSYGHPHQQVLDNLSGTEILRTDLAGDIKISCQLPCNELLLTK